MGVIRSAARWVAYRAASLAGIPLRDPSAASLFGYADTAAGVAVTEHTALTYSAVWAAVRLIAESTSTVPLYLFRRTGSDKELATDHPLFDLPVTPNAEMTGVVYRETTQAHVLTWGNEYSEIERDRAGRPLALWPLTPDRVHPDRDRAGQVAYIIRQRSGNTAVARPDDMLHVPGLGYDGLLGYSVVGMARQAIGLGLATERFGATFFGNGARPGGFLEYPGKLTEKGVQNLRESFNLIHQGPHRAHRLAILQEGAKFSAAQIPPEDAQFLETRKFSIAEIARWFNVPPHLLRDLDRATFSNIEHQGIEFVTLTVRPWLRRREAEWNRKLLTEKERRAGFFFQHLTDELERGDLHSRYSAYAIGRQWGWLSADDVREREGMNPLPDEQGKIYLIPTNMHDAAEPEPEPVEGGPVNGEGEGTENPPAGDAGAAGEG